MWQAIQNLQKIRKNPLALFEKLSKDGPVVQFAVPTATAFLITDPDAAEELLVTQAKSFSKTTRGYRMLRRLLGNGLVTSDGEFWLKQRRTAQPAFHRERIAALGERMTRITADTLDKWSTGTPFDVHEAMMGLTLRVVADTLLSSDISGSTSDIGDAVSEAVEQAIWRVTHPIYWPRFVPTPRNRRYEKARATLDDNVHRFINERRATEPGHDLLGMLMEARDPETGEGMSNEQLRDEIMTIFLAGHETTANALSWAFALLAQHPEIEEKARQEAQHVLQGPMDPIQTHARGKAPQAADLPRLPYIGAVVKETMRLYPPVWMVGRGALQDVQIAGTDIKRGNYAFVSTWAMHRNPKLWERPLSFEPERWLDPNFKPHKCAYLPFITGPRKCIGDGFALMEATFVLAMTLERFRLRAEALPEPEPLITLRPKHGLKMVAEPVDQTRSSSTPTPSSTMMPNMMMKMISVPNFPV